MGILTIINKIIIILTIIKITQIITKVLIRFINRIIIIFITDLEIIITTIFKTITIIKIDNIGDVKIIIVI